MSARAASVIGSNPLSGPIVGLSPAQPVSNDWVNKGPRVYCNVCGMGNIKYSLMFIENSSTRSDGRGSPICVVLNYMFDVDITVIKCV